MFNFSDLFDTQKPILTRNGLMVTIIRIEQDREINPVLGLLHAKEIQPFFWQPNGLWGHNKPNETHQLDLIPNKRESGWGPTTPKGGTPMVQPVPQRIAA